MSLRKCRIRRGVARRISSPLKMISPEVGSSSLRMRLAVVDFPDPDSPTRPSVSPGHTSNETLSTAGVSGSVFGSRWRRDFWRPKLFVSPLTRSRGLPEWGVFEDVGDGLSVGVGSDMGGHLDRCELWGGQP